MNILFSLFMNLPNCFYFNQNIINIIILSIQSIVRIENKNYDGLIIDTIFHLKKKKGYF